ncbi:hypothetical protein HY638_05425 [Candidatus Woesearchaeota archaeon]|nr:hypothetical protein [Candidatus Woesearchaeota archaeon]
MNTQINLRLPPTLASSAKAYARRYGYGTVQDFIKETVREKLFGPGISKKELALVKKLGEASDINNLYGSEEALFQKLRRKKDGIHLKAV